MSIDVPNFKQELENVLTDVLNTGEAGAVKNNPAILKAYKVGKTAYVNYGFV